MRTFLSRRYKMSVLISWSLASALSCNSIIKVVFTKPSCRRAGPDSDNRGGIQLPEKHDSHKLLPGVYCREQGSETRCTYNRLFVTSTKLNMVSSKYIINIHIYSLILHDLSDFVTLVTVTEYISPFYSHKINLLCRNERKVEKY